MLADVNIICARALEKASKCVLLTVQHRNAALGLDALSQDCHRVTGISSSSTLRWRPSWLLSWTRQACC